MSWNMTHADLAAHYRAKAKHFHDLAQRARKAALEAKERRDFLAKLKHEIAAREYRNTRDEAKGLAKRHANLA